MYWFSVQLISLMSIFSLRTLISVHAHALPSNGGIRKHFCTLLHLFKQPILLVNIVVNVVLDLYKGQVKFTYMVICVNHSRVGGTEFTCYSM